MAEKFLITGLPRSRTAWLSVLTTTAKSICFHEPVQRCESYADFKRVFDDDRYQHVGVADSALILQIGRILNDFRPKTLIVRRNPVDCARSLRRYFGADLGSFDVENYCHTMDEHLGRYIGVRGVQFVDYEDFGKPEAIAAVLAYLLPGVPQPKMRELMSMNVQAMKSDVLASAKKGHPNWHLDRSWESAAA